MSHKGLILVTGVTGFIAGHVADQLVAAGYTVRGTARGAKARALSQTVQRQGMEFVQVDNLTDSDLTKPLEGVSAIIHIASPLPGKANLDDAKEGTLNILRGALKAGIEKIVVTGSAGNLMNPDQSDAFPGKVLTSKAWGHVALEEAKEIDPSQHPAYVYFASKLLAERALWDFVKQHPQLDVVTILPSLVLGPYAETYPRPITKETLNMNSMIHAIMSGPTSRPPPYFVADVRDVAKAHVLALDLPRNPGAIERRYIMNSGSTTWRKITDHLKITHRELNFLPASEYPDTTALGVIFDTSSTIAELNFGKFIDTMQTIDDVVVALQEVEKAWA